MKDITYKLTNVSPLLMHNVQLADPMNHWAKEIKRISSKRKKVDADLEEMSRLEFLGGLYMTQVEGKFVPCLPSALVEATLISAGRKRKLGKQVESGVFVRNDTPITYEGPTDPTDLWKTNGFRSYVPVKVNKARIMRTRPKFTDWTANVTVSFHESDIDQRTIGELMVIAGEEVGIGDWRPRYGRFNVSEQTV